MTAEIAILNPHAVALAADSAVTVTGVGRKIYNTATKLFALSTQQPIAVMYYGNSVLGSLPWETAIKQFRRARAGFIFKTVADTAADFVRYVSRFESHISDSDRLAAAQRLAVSELEQLATLVDYSREHRQRVGRRFTVASERATLKHLTRARMSQLEAESPHGDVSAAESRQLLRAAVPDWLKFTRQQLRDSVRDVNQAAASELRDLVARSLRVTVDWEGATGLVITGFGSDQVFPELVHYRLEGAIGRNIRVQLINSYNLETDRQARILPFAQSDMVTTLLSGLHPLMAQFLTEFVPDSIEIFGEHFVSRVEALLTPAQFRALKADLPGIRNAVLSNFFTDINSEIRVRHISPVVSVAASLPKEELAEMAETLVHLTSFRRRITPQDETVGGPVDVAIISAGDGLVWIKRKHYFPSNLNFRYFQQNRLESARS